MNFVNKFLTVSILGCALVFAQEASVVPAQTPAVDSTVAAPASEAEQPAPETVSVVNDSAAAPVQEVAEPAPEVLSAQNTESVPQFPKISDLKQEQEPAKPKPVVCPVCPSGEKPEKLLRFQFGAHLRLGQVIYDDADYDFSGLNWAAGLAFILPLNERFVFLKVEPVFSSRSLTDVIDNNSGSMKVFIDEYNLELPLLITFRIPNTFLQLFVGPQVTLNLRETIKVTEDGKTLLKIKDGDTSREPLEWGIVLGAGFVLGKHMDLDVRMNLGISDVYKDLWIQTGNNSPDNFDFIAIGFYMGMSFYL